MWTGREVAPGADPGVAGRSFGGRLHYLDSIRIALSALVILHHAAQPYGPVDWWYVEGEPKARWIEDFAVLNAPFKMSLFFLIAAYFLPAAVDRRHERPYLGPRLRKLGGPILIGFFLVIPVLMFAYYRAFRGYGPIGFGDYYANVYLGAGEEPAGWSGPIWPDRQFGHLWFIQHLLVYSLLYLAWRAFADRVRVRRGEEALPGVRDVPERVGGLAVLGFAAVVAVGTALLRVRYAVDEWMPVAEIIQTEPADLAQHVPFVVAGVLAYRRGWLETLPARVGYGWLAAAAALSVGYVAFRSDLTGFFELSGANAGQFAWAGYETVLCVGFALGMLVLFRDHVRGTGRAQRAAADATFAIYLVHLPIVVGLQYLMRDAPFGASGRFPLVAAAAFVLSVGAALLLRRTPLVRAVL
ncbi:peptidoglycan/LPS O-acetylase OafA/YrhL [Actinomadura luteofluorescens]|uniref:Peptidoglycan/LPS O-acetylase OafA/YrhL n=1 Tax=Actinomadura luteofluorescens TaxID=46163 RepID=A0A7Y9JGN4_9ACTN|nr:acyltransferase [Actinomadura luteofluorescens]NYD46509.1 peptidoglycan/LPS O-acetylase OafA/YrhL [Actinomadura luteofluorescens]